MNFTQESNLGTTQGSVCSPIIYNIYFNEFDEYVENEIRNFYNQTNLKENRKDKPANKFYNSITKRKYRIFLRVQ